jgi:hypothetical protein
VIIANTKISVMTMKRNQENCNYFVDFKRNGIKTTFGPYEDIETSLNKFLELSIENKKVCAMVIYLYEVNDKQNKKTLLKQNLTYFGVNE